MKRILFAWLLLIGLTVHGQRFVKPFAGVVQALAGNPRDIHTNFFLPGRSTPTDGGGGMFYYDPLGASVTNQGLSWAYSGYPGRLERVVEDKFDVNAAWFGAIPDDGLDDSTAIQAALDYCYIQKHGNVRLNSGVFNTSKTLYVPYRVNVIGKAGWKMTEILAATPSSSFYMLGGSTQIRIS